MQACRKDGNVNARAIANMALPATRITLTERKTMKMTRTMEMTMTAKAKVEMKTGE